VATIYVVAPVVTRTPSPLLAGRLAGLVRQLLLNDILALAGAGAALAGAGVLVAIVFFGSGLFVLVPIVPWAVLAGRWLRADGMKSVASRLERRFPLLAGRLKVALELESDPGTGREGYSQELKDAAVAQVVDQLALLPIGQLVPRCRLVWTGGAAMAVLALLLGYCGLFPLRAKLGLANAFAPNQVQIALTVQPGDTTVMPGAQVTLRCLVRPAGLFRRVRLEVYDGCGHQSTRTLPLSRCSRFSPDAEFCAQTVIPAGSGWTYRFRLLSRSSPLFRVTVAEPLLLKSLTFTYHYPEYTRLPEFQSSSPDIAALKGTLVTLAGAASGPVNGGWLILGQDTIPLEIDPLDQTRFTGSWTVKADGAGPLELLAGTLSQPVATVRVRVVPDEVPFVKLFLPGRNVDLPLSMQVPLGINSLDDYGLTGLWLCYGKETIDQRRLIRSLAGQREDTTLYVWDLGQSDLVPGDEISYYVAVADNDRVSGPKLGRSEVFTVRFPTMNEIYNAAVGQTERTATELVPLSGQQEQIGRELARVSDEVKRTRDLSWEEKKRLQQVLQDQEQLIQQLEAVKQEVAQAAQDMLSGMTLDKETLERLGQLQELVGQLIPRDLLQSLAELRQKLAQGSPQLREALRTFELSQDKLKAGIERALELLKRIMEEQRLEALARKAEELAEAQERLTEMLLKEPAQELAQRQADINTGLDSLERELGDLAEKLTEPELAESLAALAAELKQTGIDQLADKIHRQLQQKDLATPTLQTTRSQSRQLAKQLRQLQQTLTALSDRLKGKRSEEIAQQLAARVDELLMLSQEQERLEAAAGSVPDNASLAPRQMGLHDATRIVAESLAELAERTMAVPPELGQLLAGTMQQMADGAQHLVDNQPGLGRQKMLSARQGLNNAAQTLLRQLASARQGGGMSGGFENLLEQLSALTAEQMAINAGMNGIPIPIPSSGLTQEQLQQLAQLLSQQQALRQVLERMLQQMGGERPGLTASLEGLLEEMKAVERDLAELNVTRTLIERQESILSHLLDAQRSLRQQGFKEERQSEPGKKFAVQTVVESTDRGERNRLLREELMRALKHGYPAEYEQMIRDYFERLLNRP